MSICCSWFLRVNSACRRCVPKNNTYDKVVCAHATTEDAAEMWIEGGSAMCFMYVNC